MLLRVGFTLTLMLPDLESPHVHEVNHRHRRVIYGHAKEHTRQKNRYAHASKEGGVHVNIADTYCTISETAFESSPRLDWIRIDGSCGDSFATPIAARHAVAALSLLRVASVCAEWLSWPADIDSTRLHVRCWLGRVAVVTSGNTTNSCNGTTECSCGGAMCSICERVQDWHR